MVCQAIYKPFVSHVHYSGEQAGWVGRVPGAKRTIPGSQGQAPNTPMHLC